LIPDHADGLAATAAVLLRGVFVVAMNVFLDTSGVSKLVPELAH